MPHKTPLKLIALSVQIQRIIDYSEQTIEAVWLISESQISQLPLTNSVPESTETRVRPAEHSDYFKNTHTIIATMTSRLAYNGI